jgi:group II intron reverse transcriptase/maturase
MVPTKPTNKAGKPEAEPVEGRGPATRNPSSQNTLRTQGRKRVQSARARVREAVGRNRGAKLTALFHHIANVDALREAYYHLKKKAAPGVDGVGWEQYGEDLEENLEDLCERLKRGAYHAKPVRRTYIPKADGKRRPLGVTALEDKLVQLATVEVLNLVYEQEFRGFSYGFRPKRGQHDALDAVAVGIEQRHVNWVLDADLRAFFDTIDHEWLVRLVEHRIADRRVVRLIQKWLNAGVLEDGKLRKVEVGTPQGGSISPLLANIYLHYVLDLWADTWRKGKAKGNVIIVRYADDFVAGFQSKSEAERFLQELRERFAKFKLELHPDKTRLFEFGRYAWSGRKRRGEGRPETFDFLGLTHACDETEKGWFSLRRTTSRKKLRAKLRDVKTELASRRHDPIKDVEHWLGTVLKGHYEYYGVPGNKQALQVFRDQVTRYWRHALRRRSQKRVTWKWMRPILSRLPRPRLSHPSPRTRLHVNTRGKSPVR